MHHSKIKPIQSRIFVTEMTQIYTGFANKEIIPYKSSGVLVC